MTHDHEEVDDPMLAPVAEHWEKIVAGYKQFEDKRPVVLYDIQAKRAYLCPYEDFKSLAEQYELAGTLGKMVMFVRDNKAEKFVSYILDYK
jgi:PHD/YefM family antitoxin component YafN of YafNO toxin-antitoxin module